MKTLLIIVAFLIFISISPLGELTFNQMFHMSLLSLWEVFKTWF
jgi:hypothetical protein